MRLTWSEIGCLFRGDRDRATGSRPSTRGVRGCWVMTLKDRSVKIKSKIKHGSMINKDQVRNSNLSSPPNNFMNFDMLQFFQFTESKTPPPRYHPPTIWTLEGASSTAHLEKEIHSRSEKSVNLLWFVMWFRLSLNEMSHLDHREHGLHNIERVSPVVVCHVSVVLLHAQHPSEEDLQRIQKPQKFIQATSFIHFKHLQNKVMLRDI